MGWWRITLGALGVVLALGIGLRCGGVPWAGWLAGLAAAALVFVFLVPVMGERSRQPPGAPERRVHFGD